MRKHLLTAALAIVAVGGVFAGTANTVKGTRSVVPNTYYRSGACSIPIQCDVDFSGPTCSAQSGSFYSKPGCNASDLVTPIGNLED